MSCRRGANDGRIQMASFRHALDGVETLTLHALGHAPRSLRSAVCDRDNPGLLAIFEGLKISLRDGSGANEPKA
jgi:hypothetical protein